MAEQTPKPSSDKKLTGYQTCQFHWGGLFDSVPAQHEIHLVRRTKMGTPGPTLCGIDRFGSGRPGFSMGGGVSDPKAVPCGSCVEHRLPNLPITGSMFAALFSEASNV